MPFSDYLNSINPVSNSGIVVFISFTLLSICLFIYWFTLKEYSRITHVDVAIGVSREVDLGVISWVIYPNSFRDSGKVLCSWGVGEA